MKKDFVEYGNLSFFIAVVVINILATIGVIGGIPTRDVSYLYPSLLTPADYTFSIWGLIYILLAVLVYRQIKNEELRDKVGYFFIASCVLNIAWLFAWQYKNIVMSFIFIFALMINLLMLMKRLKDSDPLNLMAVGLYTGWVNVAMLANLGALFTRYNWFMFGLSSSTTSVIGLAFGMLWISFFILDYCNIYYALGSCWGYIGIARASGLAGVKTMALIGAVVFTVCAIFATINKKSIDGMCKC